jgi:hypothetical protein
MAVAITGRPHILAAALKRFYTYEEEYDGPGEDPHSPRIRLEEYSHALQLETRIARLEQEVPDKESDRWLPFALSMSIILVVNYFIV